MVKEVGLVSPAQGSRHEKQTAFKAAVNNKYA
jgi:hypothetical protein